MKPEIKKLWVEALRSGKYKQGRDFLCDKENKYCCLGVLTDLYNKKMKKKKKDKGFCGDNGVLSHTVMDWAGLSSLNGSEVEIEGYEALLSEHNDAGKDFQDIADAIEAQL